MAFQGTEIEHLQKLNTLQLTSRDLNGSFYGPVDKFPKKEVCVTRAIVERLFYKAFHLLHFLFLVLIICFFKCFISVLVIQTCRQIYV